jgi:hypothetical protein
MSRMRARRTEVMTAASSSRLWRLAGRIVAHALAQNPV